MLLQLMRMTVGLALFSAVATAGVLEVHSDGSGDFTSLQAAVDAAVSDDILLVQSDFVDEYVTVAGKGLTIVGELNQRPKVGGMAVVQVPAGEKMILRGLEFGPFVDVFPSQLEQKLTLAVGSCLGAVLIEDCKATGIAGTNLLCQSTLQYCTSGHPALFSLGNTCLIITRCTFVGGAGLDHTTGSVVPGFGGKGLYAFDQNTVYVYDSTLLGGRGGNSIIGDGGNGGEGLYSLGGHLWVEGSTVIGGVGGNGCYPPAEPFTNDCQGGDGIFVKQYFQSGGDLFLRDVISQGGLGGLLAPDGSGIPAYGFPGDDIFQDPNDPDGPWEIPGVAVRAIDLSPVYEGQPGTTTILGPPTAFAGYVLSLDLGHLLLGGNKGFLAAGFPLLGPYLLGPIPATGVLELSYTTPALGPLFEGFTFVKQALVQDADGLRLSSPTAYVHLGPAP